MRMIFDLLLCHIHDPGDSSKHWQRFTLSNQKRRGSRIKGKDLIVNPKPFIRIRDITNIDRFPFFCIGRNVEDFYKLVPEFRLTYYYDLQRLSAKVILFTFQYRSGTNSLTNLGFKSIATVTKKCLVLVQFRFCEFLFIII
jgi:hypothetical protein